MQHYSALDIVNVGTGEDISILELALLVRDVVGCSGKIVHDLSKPDGTPRKLLDVSRLTALGERLESGYVRESSEPTRHILISPDAVQMRARQSA